MAKFFVGQRVRVTWVRNSKFSNEIGKEGQITQTRDGRLGTVYSLDTSPFVYEGFTVYGYYEDQLEPILYEGNQPCGMSYEEMMQEFKEKVS